MIAQEKEKKKKRKEKKEAKKKGQHCCQKKKKKKKRKKQITRGNVEKDINKSNLKKFTCTCIWAYLSIKKKFILTQFSLHFGEKIFWWARGENTWAPLFIFLHSYPLKHTPKKISSLFSFQNFPSTLFHLQTNTALMFDYMGAKMYLSLGEKKKSSTSFCSKHEVSLKGHTTLAIISVSHLSKKANVRKWYFARSNFMSNYFLIFLQIVDVLNSY